MSNEMLEHDSLTKANYVGNKRRLAKYIVGKFPQGGRTIFDPMAGCSAVLIEAARRGYRVKGNDLSVVPYWYSKGVFEGKPLSEADVEKLTDAPLHDGWLTTEWKGVYPRPRQVRRFLDGLAKRAREWPGLKGWAAKAVASRVLQTLYSDSISGYSTRRYESLPAVRGVVEHAVKEVNGLIVEVGGKGAITNEDAKRARFPRADVVYFDPPFFKRDKGFVHYFETYRIMNSILLGREWKQENLKPEDIPEILNRLCKSCRHIFISTSSNELVPYAKELARHKRTTKRYRLAYRQASGFGSRDERQREHLYVAKAESDSEAPYLTLPQESETYRYVVQEHFRGKSMHADLRYEAPDRKGLIGWTLATATADAVSEPVTSAEEAGKVPKDVSRVNWESGKFVGLDGAGGIVAIPKEKHERSWLAFEGEVEEPEGEASPAAGATRNYPGVFRIVDKGTVEYGSQKVGFHEYFFGPDRAEGGLRDRIVFRRLPPRNGQGVWLMTKPENQLPYVLSDTAVSDGWVPPEGFSALPASLRSNVPKEYLYWEKTSEAERLRVRDELARAIKEGEVSIEKSEDQGDFEKRKLIPFNQWGGSAKYAAALAKRLPEHRRYVEPFCGSAALFFAKEPADEEVLADADPEVVFALKYIQRLTPEKMEDLKRFSWTVSRAGFSRVKECDPKSEAERFWRHVYGRLCAWGGKPKMSGYSTINEGKTYGLEDLWRFKERLAGTQIIGRDWKETLAAFNGTGTLFFIDPPYVEEWGGDEGIPPEDIAEQAAKLKGDFVVAYTDSARARRALSKVGRLFKMKFLEARHAGMWAKRNRLFAASFDTRKAMDIEPIEMQEAALCSL